MNLGGPEILVIIVLAVLVLGPDKLPGALRMFGRAMGEVKKYQDLAKNEIEKAMAMPDTSSSNTTVDDEDSPSQEDEPSSAEFSSENKTKRAESPDVVPPIIDDDEL